MSGEWSIVNSDPEPAAPGFQEGEVIQDYRDLRVWSASVDLAVDTFRTTRSFPAEEKFGAVAQMRRSANSIPANIAEGFGREQTGSFIQFLRIAQGSLKELETHIIIATRVEMLAARDSERLMAQTTVVGKMLRSYIRSLAARNNC
ncbi:MAG: four helix bundle protein [Parvularculaceae bacterium]|nr:four helix bundle protein [Parvularculaceae bacterium]